jgi:trigger factor
MKILKSKRKNDIYTLKIEENHDAMESSLDKAFKKLSKSAKIPGFRKGKLTRNIFEKHYGKEMLVQEAIMDVINNAYLDAIKELDLDIIDYPKNIDIGEYKENEPITFSCEVDVKPEIKLGKYKGLKTKKDKKNIGEEEVAAQIDRMRENYAKYENADRPTQVEDFIRCDIIAKIGDNEIASITKKNVGLKIGTELYGKEFDENVQNMKINDKKEFEVTYPEDYHNKEVAGKAVSFSVMLIELREKTLPELTDEFVSKISQHKTATELQSELQKELENNAEKEAEEKIKSDLIEKAIENSKTVIQPVLIEREIDQSMKSFEAQLKQSGLSVDRYKEFSKKSDSDLRADFAKNAEKTVKTELILEAIAVKEKIEVTETDLIEEIKNWKIPNVNSDEEIKKELDRINKKGLELILKRKKALDLIMSNAKIS